MIEEANCIERAQRGDVEAFTALMMQHEKRIFSIAYRMMGIREDAFDVAQETMIKIFHSLPKFRAQCTFAVWIYRITVNTCMDELRRRKRRPGVSIEALNEAGLQLESGQGDPASALENTQLKKALAEAILQLDGEYRMAIVLRDVQGLSYQEIAQATNTTLGTVKSRISRGRAMLQKSLAAQGYTPR